MVFRQIVVEVTGFEPATFWSRKLTLFDQCESDYPSLSTIDRICSDGKAPSVGEFAWQTTGLKVPAVMDTDCLLRIASRVAWPETERSKTCPWATARTEARCEV